MNNLTKGRKMSYEQLVMWLHGMFEYRDISAIDHEECKKMLQGIKDHVAMNFMKITPILGKVDNKKNDIISTIPPDTPKRPFPSITFPPGPGIPGPIVWPGKIPGYDFDDSRYWTTTQQKPNMLITC